MLSKRPAPRHGAVVTAVVLAMAGAGLRPAFAQSVPGQPISSLWYADPASGKSILNWDPLTDPDAAFNKSNVPLASRIGTVNNVNPNAKVGQGGVSALVAFNQPGNSNSQGSASRGIYAPGFWQYMDDMVFFGGSAGSGSIIAPTATATDAAHRNGVPMLGTVYLAPTVYGGTAAEVNAFLTRNSDGSFPVADKMILAAHTYGFDGWFLNQETNTTTSADAAKMVSFIKYMKAKAPDLRVQWYDAMNESGSVGWQGQLDSANDAFIGPSNAKVSDSMFVDFRGTGDVTTLTNSSNYAKGIGRSPYELYSGVDFESRGYGIAGDTDKIFGSGGNHLTSLGIYRPEYTYNNSNKSDQNDFYNRDSVFWVGQNADPSNTATSNAWKGIANYVPAKSPVAGSTFVTNFNMGVGSRYMINGQQLATGDWNNLSLQDVMPTYRWIISTTGSKLAAQISNADAYYGGTSLLFSGTLNAVNDIKLYQTDLSVAADTKFKIALKPSQADPLLKLAVTFSDASVAYVGVPAGLDPTKWNTVTLDLGAYAGKTITNLGLRVGTGAETVASYALRLGQFAMYRGTQDIPAAPTAVSVDSQLAVAKAAATTASLPLRIHWNHSTDTPYEYNVYRRKPDGTLAFLGATPNNAYFVPGLTRVGTENFVTLEVETIGSEFGASSHATKTFYVDWPRPGQVLDWQSDGSTNGGSGTWDASNLNWNAGASAPVNQFWSNAHSDTARFAGTGGVVTLAAPVTVGGLAFTGDGYSLEQGTVTLIDVAALSVSNGDSATIRSTLAGTVGLKKVGGGTALIASKASYTGATRLAAGRLSLGVANALPAASDLALDGGTLDTNGFSQTMAKLSLLSDSSLNFGALSDSANVLSFSGVDTIAGQLSITHWDGSASGAGSDRLLLASLADAQRLAANVVFVNPAGFAPGAYPATAVSVAEGGEVVPVPEPAVMGVGLVAVVGIGRRHANRTA